MNKRNCWDSHACKVREQCPAYPDKGHACFAVEGTLCRGEKQGEYGDKIRLCRQTCEFYKTAVLRQDK